MNTKKATRYRRTKADIYRRHKKNRRRSGDETGLFVIIGNRNHQEGQDRVSCVLSRYKDLGEFYSEFVKGYDYWFSQIADDAMKSSDNPKAQFIALMKGLQNSLTDRSVMQELRRWEVAERNDTTKRTAMLREAFTLPLTEKYKALFENTCVDFVALASLLIGGLYYLNLHKERSKFCGIDMQKEEDVERINKVIKTFTEIMFSFRNWILQKG